MANEDFSFSIGADASNALKTIAFMEKVVQGAAKNMANFDLGLGKDAAKQQASIRRTLKTYGELANMLGKVGKNAADLSKINDLSNKSMKTYGQTVRAMAKSLNEVVGTSEADYASKKRTIDLYHQQAAAAAKHTSELVKELQAQNALTQARAKANQLAEQQAKRDAIPLRFHGPDKAPFEDRKKIAEAAAKAEAKAAKQREAAAAKEIANAKQARVVAEMQNRLIEEIAVARANQYQQIAKLHGAHADEIKDTRERIYLATLEDNALKELNNTKLRNLKADEATQHRYEAGALRAINDSNAGKNLNGINARDIQKAEIALNALAAARADQYAAMQKVLGASAEDIAQGRLRVHQQTLEDKSLQALTATRLREVAAQERSAHRFNLGNAKATANIPDTKQVDNFTAAQRRLNLAMKEFDEVGFSQQFALNRLATVYGAIAVGAAGTAAAVGVAAAKFEQSFAQLGVSIGVAELGSEFEDLKEQIVDLSTEVPPTVEELSEIASAGAQMGVATEDLDNFTKVIAMFATQSNVAADQAALLFGRIEQLAKVPPENLERFASTVVKLGRDSAATEAEILKTTQSIAASATDAGISEEKIVGLSTALASLGVPPEWARGSLQRIFAQVNRAADAGVQGMEKYASVMGVTAEESLSLLKSDPTAFYLRLIQGIDGAAASGRSFTQVMDDLGVRNTRDVQLLQRLSASHELVAQSVGSAVTEYQNGSYLQENFNAVVETTINTLKRLWNSVVAFGAAAGEHVLPLVQKLAVFLTGLFEAARGLGAVLTPIAPILASVVAPLFALKAASATATAAMGALRTIGDKQAASTVRQVGRFRELAAAYLGAGISAGKAAAGVESHMSQQQKLSALQRKSAVEQIFYNKQLEKQRNKANKALSGMANPSAMQDKLMRQAADNADLATRNMGKMQRATTAASVAMGNAAAAVRGFAGAVASTFVFGVAIAAIVELFTASSRAAEKAKAEQEAYNETINGYVSAIMSAGGQEGLSEAINKDSQAFQELGAAASDASTLIQTSYQDMGNGVVKATQVVTDLNTGISTVGDSHETYGVALENTTQKQIQLSNGMMGTINVIDEQTSAIGANTKAWEQRATLDFIQGLSDEDLDKFKASGVNLAEVFAAGISGGLPAVKEAMAEQRKAAEQELAAAEQLLNAKIGVGGYNTQAFADAARASQQLAAIKAIEDTYGGLENSIENAATKQEIWNAALEEAAVNGLNLQGIEPFENFIPPEAITGGVEDLASALADVYNEAFKLVDIQGALYAALEGLGQGIVENGGNFDVVTEEGRANMDNLKEVVNAAAAVMAHDIEQGMNPAQAAAQMQATMQQLFNDLSNMGVDTSQLDWLMDYINQFVSEPVVLTVGADGQPAIDTTNEVINAVNGSNGLITVDADTSAAVEKINQILAAVENADGLIGLALNKAAQLAKMQLMGVGSGIAGGAGGWFGGGAPGFKAPKLTMPSMDLGNSLQQGQYKGLEQAASDAGKAAEKAMGDAKDATDAQNDALEAQKRYVSDLANYYANLGNEMFKAVDAEGGTFKAIQELGAALQENGKHFNTFTEGGRANFDALSNALNEFGGILSLQVERGVLSAGAATAQFSQYASGLYSELIKLGVPAREVSGFFNALGASASKGWSASTAGVRQFAGVLTAANKAAKGTAGSVAAIANELKKAKEWADLLGDAFDNANAKFFGKDRARDAGLEAIYSMRDAYQDALDKLTDLREEQQKLNADLATATADRDKANIEAAISAKYGETDREAEYRAQAAEAQARVDSISTDLKDNDAEIKSMEKYQGVLSGTSKEAVENRKSILELQDAMLDSIQAYAAAGATTAEVNKYTAEMKKEFVATAKASGYSQSAIAKYSKAFDNYVKIVKSTPKTVVTTATANTDPAKAALNAIPKRGSHLTMATANTSQAVAAVRAIPKSSTYTVNAKANPSSVGATRGTLNGLAAGKTMQIYPYVNGTSLASAVGVVRRAFSSITAGIGVTVKRNEGGMVPGFASGGRIPGRSPRDPKIDNLIAKVDGKGQIAVRSGEYIQSEPAVDYYGESFMNAVNQRQLPKDIARFASGGMPAPVGYSGGMSSVGGGTALVELSPTDRSLLQKVADNMNVTLVTNDRTIAESANRGNKQLNRRGNNA